MGTVDRYRVMVRTPAGEVHLFRVIENRWFADFNAACLDAVLFLHTSGVDPRACEWWKLEHAERLLGTHWTQEWAVHMAFSAAYCERRLNELPQKYHTPGYKS